MSRARTRARTRARSRARLWRWSWLGLALLTGCGLQVSALDEAPSAKHTVAPGAWIVLTNQDLQQLPEAVRLAAGKVVEVSLPPLVLGDATLAGTTLTVQTSEGTASVTAAQDLALAFPLSSPTVNLAWTRKGQAACGLTWKGAASLSIALHLGRTGDGAVDVVLAGAPTVDLGQDAVDDSAGCLDAAGAHAAVAKHVSAAVTSALASAYVKSARASLMQVIPPGMEVAARVAMDVQGHNAVARVQTRLRSPGPAAGVDPEPSPGEGSLIHHNGSYAATALEVGLDVSRHPCAMDMPPPAVPLSSLPVKAPVAPGGSGVLRRAAVLDRALLAHLTWAALRSGTLCRGVSRGIEKLLPATWATDTVPALGGLVGSGAVGARFWPGGAPTVRVIDREGGAAVEWLLPDAVLEISAPVAGVELVVLRVEGTFRLVLAPSLNAGLGFKVVAGFVDSAALSSPLLPASDVASGAGLAGTVDAAIKGIFSDVLGLSAPVGGAVVIGSSRVGDHLWLWIEGGALPTLPTAQAP